MNSVTEQSNIIPLQQSPAQTPAGPMMTCEDCGLAGGPFHSAAEAAHLRAVHNQLHHGIPAA